MKQENRSEQKVKKNEKNETNTKMKRKKNINKFLGIY